MQTLQVPQGNFPLQRLPIRKKETLFPWDAADELLLNYVEEQHVLEKDARLVIVNDQFGALAVALAEYHPTVMSDSLLAFKAIAQNLENNTVDPKSLTLLPSTEELQVSIDVLLIKVPRTLAALEDQLRRLRPQCHDKTRIIAAGMTKNIHNSTLSLFETIIGTTETSLAKKKARLIFSQWDASLEVSPTPYPTSYPLENTEYKIINHAGVFSAQSLDIGTRFFLQHIPASTTAQRIVDLGCGNGVVGLDAALKNPQAEIIFTDESYQAVASAEVTFRAAFGDSRQASFIVTDCLQGLDAESVDLILVNPPFHQHNALTTHTASQMFREAKQVLKQGGEIRVIGNRHLNYHLSLKRLYGNYINIASNKKFAILKAVKR
jgi:16S rRNA (guanine1207-N2)-methyltransferase